MGIAYHFYIASESSLTSTLPSSSFILLSLICLSNAPYGNPLNSMNSVVYQKVVKTVAVAEAIEVEPPLVLPVFLPVLHR